MRAGIRYPNKYQLNVLTATFILSIFFKPQMILQF